MAPRYQLLLLVLLLGLGTISTQTCNCDVAKLNDIGIINGNIPGSSFAASSLLDAFHAPSRARLKQAAQDPKGSAWCAEKQNSKQYLQVDLVYSSKITHIATQGMFDPPQNANGNNVENWVKEYEVQYSIDGEHFISYDVRGKVQVFEANKDGNSIKCCELPYPIVVKHIRFHPISWHGRICMRIGLFGAWNATAHTDASKSNISIWHYWWCIFFLVAIIFAALVLVIFALAYYCCLRKKHNITERPKSLFKRSREDPNLKSSSVIIYNSKTKIKNSAPFGVKPADVEVQEMEADFTEEGQVDIPPPNY